MQIGVRALDECLSLQKKSKPLIYCISNSLLLKDLAECITAYNGIPVFLSSLIKYNIENEELASLLVSFEDLTEDKVQDIEKSIRIARRRKMPIILDLVGEDISFIKKETALSFINRYNIDVVIGSITEFKAIINNKNTMKEEISYTNKFKEDIEVRVSLRNFSKANNMIVVVKNEEYYLTDGYSEFFIDREMNRENYNLFEAIKLEYMLAALISVGVAAAGTSEEKFISVLVAIMTMAVSEKIVVQKNLKDESILNKKYLIDEIINVNSDKLNKLSKIDYLFVR
ncbi:hydroxyethylthiazole kinase [Clostridium tertium]|uniref:hydroxyethylthiazole kinase n=1 Tax=Clostridium tertium TaxID=1559 RepID=A0A6N3E794_9CLOT